MKAFPYFYLEQNALGEPGRGLPASRAVREALERRAPARLAHDVAAQPAPHLGQLAVTATAPVTPPDVEAEVQELGRGGFLLDRRPESRRDELDFLVGFVHRHFRRLDRGRRRSQNRRSRNRVLVLFPRFSWLVGFVSDEEKKEEANAHFFFFSSVRSRPRNLRGGS